MGTIRVHEFMTLDGVIDTPTWTADYGFDPRMGQAIADVMAGCDGILLGRKTFEMFEPAWSSRTADEDPGAPFMNNTAKFVVSSTLESTNWNQSSSIGAYDPAKIRELKESRPGGMYVSGSGTLVRSLISDELVDELHLFVYPISVGSGPRLFDVGQPTRKWSLLRAETYDNGVAYLAYEGPRTPTRG